MGIELDRELKARYTFGYPCAAACPPGKGCRYRKQKKMTWVKLEKLCPKKITVEKEDN